MPVLPLNWNKNQAHKLPISSDCIRLSEHFGATLAKQTNYFILQRLLQDSETSLSRFPLPILQQIWNTCYIYPVRVTLTKQHVFPFPFWFSPLSLLIYWILIFIAHLYNCFNFSKLGHPFFFFCVRQTLALIWLFLFHFLSEKVQSSW